MAINIGNDFGGKGNVTSPSECCNLCATKKGCYSWAYLITYQYCYYKKVVLNELNKQDYPNMVSGGVLNYSF